MSQVVQAIIDSLLLFVQKITVFILLFAGRTLLDDKNFVPTKVYFEKMVGGEDNLGKIMRLFQSAGIYLAIGIVAIVIFFMLTSLTMDIKDSLGSLMLKLVTAIIMVYLIPSVLNGVLTSAHTFYTQAVVSVIGADGSILAGTSEDAITAGYDDFFEALVTNVSGDLVTNIDDEALTETDTSSYEDNADIGIYDTANKVIDTITVASLTLGPEMAVIYGLVKLVTLIIQLIFYIALTYNAIKLMFEIVKHYVTMMSLFMVSPMFGAFYASASSQAVLLSFVKMFALEVGLLIGTKVWVVILLLMMSSFSHGIIGLSAMIAFARIGLSLTNILKGMGLSTAQTGGALLDTVAMTAGVAFLAAGRAKGAAGVGLANWAGATNNTGLMKAANVLLGRPADAATAAASMVGTPGYQFRKAIDLKNGGVDAALGAAGTLHDATLRDLDKLRAGNNRAFAQMYGELTPQNKQQYLNHLIGDRLGETARNNPTSLNAALEKSGFKNAHLELDKNFDPLKDSFTGRIVGENGTANVALSSKPQRENLAHFQDADGNEMYLGFEGWEERPEAFNSSMGGKLGDDDSPFEAKSMMDLGNEGVSSFLNSDLNDKFSTRENANGGMDILDSSSDDVLAHVEPISELTPIGDTDDATAQSLEPFTIGDTVDGYQKINESASGFDIAKTDSIEPIAHVDTYNSVTPVKDGLSDTTLSNINAYVNGSHSGGYNASQTSDGGYNVSSAVTGDVLAHVDEKGNVKPVDIVVSGNFNSEQIMESYNSGSHSTAPEVAQYGPMIQAYNFGDGSYLGKHESVSKDGENVYTTVLYRTPASNEYNYSKSSHGSKESGYVQSEVVKDKSMLTSIKAKLIRSTEEHWKNKGQGAS